MATLKVPPAILEIVTNYAKEKEKTIEGALVKLVKIGHARHVAVRKLLDKNRKKRLELAKKKELEAKKRRAARRAAGTADAASEGETKAA